MKVVNVIRNGVVSDQDAFAMLVGTIGGVEDSVDQKKNNYTLTNLDLENHLSYDMLVNDQDGVICFSGIYKRPPSKYVPGWPDGFYRICNRTYVNPAFRTSMYQFFNPNIIGEQQIRENADLIRFAFISREKPKAKYTFIKMKNSFPYYSDWTVHPLMVQVVPTVEKKSAYHRVFYKELVPTEFPFKTISEDEYALLPD